MEKLQVDRNHLLKKQLLYIQKKRTSRTSRTIHADRVQIFYYVIIYHSGSAFFTFLLETFISLKSENCVIQGTSKRDT